jgi:hypothetical protein
VCSWSLDGVTALWTASRLESRTLNDVLPKPSSLSSRERRINVDVDAMSTRISTNLSLQSVVAWPRPRSRYTIEYCVQPPVNESIHDQKHVCLIENLGESRHVAAFDSDNRRSQGDTAGKIGLPSNSLRIMTWLYRHILSVKGQRDRAAHIELLDYQR